MSPDYFGRRGLRFMSNRRIAGLISAFVLYGCVLVLMKAVFYLWHGAEIRFYKRSFDVSQKFFEAHLMKAMESDLQIMVTLESGKVYIGWAKSVRRRADIKWLTLLPVISGYRDDEQALQIMVDYSGTLLKKAFSQRHTAGDLNLDITLPVEKIATLQFFDADFYRSINPHPAG